MKRQKKAQIKMLETIFVLIMFFFIVAIGLKFYGGIQIRELEKTQSDFERLDSIKIANIIISMPELSCTNMNQFYGSCVDYYKALAWNETDKSFLWGSYLPVLGESTVKLKLLYPNENVDGLQQNITIYDNPPNKIRKTLLTQIPIVVYDGIDETFIFGELYITTYQIAVV